METNKSKKSGFSQQLEQLELNKDGDKFHASLLLPPSAFSSPPAAAASEILLSPEKFRSLPQRKTVRIQTEKPISSSDDEFPPCSPRKYARLMSKICKDNTENVKPQTASCAQVEVNAEIERLRRDNYRLMEENLKKTYEYCAKPQGDAPQPLQPSQQNTSRHLDSLISKQAEEINEYKQKLVEMRREHDQVVVDLQRELAVQERSYEHDLDSFRDQHAQQLQALEDKRVSAEEDNKNKELKVLTQYNSLKEELLESEQVASQLSSAQEELQRANELLNSQLSEMQSNCDAKEKTIRQLLTQLRAHQQREGAKERWPQDKEELNARIMAMSGDSERMKEENVALNLRLSAINDVLAAQQDSLRASTAGKTEQDKVHDLLNRWRNKVFQLLVQQKSHELVMNCEKQKFEERGKTMEAQIWTLKTKIKELESLIRDREGQITIVTGKNQNLELSTSELKNKLSHFEDRAKADKESLKKLTPMITDFSQRFQAQSQTLEAVDVKLAQQQAQIVSANRQLKLCAVKIESCVSESTELRCQLSDKVRECETTTQRLADSELVKVDFQQKCTGYQQTLLTQVKLVKEQEETIRRLTDDLDKLTKHSHIEAKRGELEVERKYKDMISQYELDISELKKELAKTIVSLRQLERKLDTQRAEHSRQLEEVTSQSRDKVARAEFDLTNAQVERNMLHANLTAAVKGRTKPRQGWRQRGSVETTPVKADTGDHSLAALSPTDKRSLLGSITKLAASVLDSDSDSDADVSEGDTAHPSTFI